MDEQKIDQLIAAIESVVDKVDQLSAENEEIKSRLDELDSVLYDGIIGPTNEAVAQEEYDNALSDFRMKYAEVLGPHEGAVKAIEGDDFDMYKKAFDTYNEGNFDMSPDEYVHKLAENIASQVAEIKEKLNTDEVEVKVTADENGEPEVEVEAECNAEKSEEEEEEKEADKPSDEWEGVEDDPRVKLVL